MMQVCERMGIELFQERISNTSGQSPYPISSVIKDLPCEGEDDDEDDDDEDDEEEETALEGVVSTFVSIELNLKKKTKKT